MANEVQLSFSEKLTDKLVSVEKALPKDFNRERFVQNALTVINEKPELAKINPAHLQLGLLRAAYLGADFVNKECYLVPFGNSVQFMLSYIGKVKFVKKYSIRPIKDLYAKVVREGDEFSAGIENGQAYVNFKEIPFNSGEIVGVFAVVQYVDGGLEYETMTTKEVNDVRNNYSKASRSGAWTKSWSEMARKTAISRITKHIECDFESVEARQSWEESSDVEFDNVAKVNRSPDIVDAFAKKDEPEIIDGTFTEVDDLPDFLKEGADNA